MGVYTHVPHKPCPCHSLSGIPVLDPKYRVHVSPVVGRTQRPGPDFSSDIAVLEKEELSPSVIMVLVSIVGVFCSEQSLYQNWILSRLHTTDSEVLLRQCFDKPVLAILRSVLQYY